MLYLERPPETAFSFRKATVGTALTRAAEAVIWDFAHGEPRPWQYYAGVMGGVVAASEPGVGAIVYVVGSVADLWFRTGPDAGDLGVFVNGVAQSDITAYAAAVAWEVLHLEEILTLGINEIKLLVKPSASHPENEGIVGVGPVRVGDAERPRQAPFRSELAGDVWGLTTSLRDANACAAAHTLYLPGGPYSHDLATDFADEYVARLAPVIAGRVSHVSLWRRLVGLGAGYAEPEADTNEGLHAIYAGADNPSAFSHRLATWRDAFTYPDWDGKRRLPRVTAPEVQAFFALMTDAEALGYPANPCDARGEPLTALRTAAMQYRE